MTLPILSVVVPGIRTHNWAKLYDSIELACKNYTFEVLFIGPFEPPREISNKITYFKDYGSPTRCTCIGMASARGDMIYSPVDDGIMLEDSLDQAIDRFRLIDHPQKIMNITYREGNEQNLLPMPPTYWKASSFAYLPLINPNWNIALHQLMYKSLYTEYGGLDSQFEHVNFALHDLAFRIQLCGGVVVNSPVDGCCASWYQGRTGDHAPIHDSHNEHDLPLFNAIYNNIDILKSRIRLDINNWRLSPAIWSRRFSAEALPAKYSDLYGHL